MSELRQVDGQWFYGTLAADGRILLYGTKEEAEAAEEGQDVPPVRILRPCRAVAPREWTPADDEAFGRLMRGTDGTPSYVRVLLTTALEACPARVRQKIMQEFAEDRLTLDQVLEKTEERAPVASSGAFGLGPEYRAKLVDIVRAQWKDDPETLNYLLSQLTGE